MEKRKIKIQCERCGDTFDYLYIGKGAKPRYCMNCKGAKPKEEAEYTENYSTDYRQRTIDVLRKLDSIRVEMCNLAQEMCNYQQGYDKNDQLYLHRLEDINPNNVSEIRSMISQWQSSRKNRRNVKNYIAVIGKIIDIIPYKNVLNAMPYINNELDIKNLAGEKEEQEKEQEKEDYRKQYQHDYYERVTKPRRQGMID